MKSSTFDLGLSVFNKLFGMLFQHAAPPYEKLFFKKNRFWFRLGQLLITTAQYVTTIFTSVKQLCYTYSGSMPLIALNVTKRSRFLNIK